MTRALISAASRNWAMFDGWAAAGGIDPMEVPLDRFVSLVYYFLVKDADKEQKDKFDARLWIPPKGVEPEAGSVWSAEGESAAFAAFAKGITGDDKPTSGGKAAASVM